MSVNMSLIKVCVSNAGGDQNGVSISWASGKVVRGGSVHFEQAHATKLGIDLRGLVVVFDLDENGTLIGIEVV